MWTQGILTCDEHEACLVINCLRDSDGFEVWRSHMSSDIDPSVRLNIDYPEALDHRGDGPGALKALSGKKIRWSLADKRSAQVLDWDETTHVLIAAHAAARFLEDGESMAKKCGVDKRILDEVGADLLSAVALVTDDAEDRFGIISSAEEAARTRVSNEIQARNANLTRQR